MPQTDAINQKNKNDFEVELGEKRNVIPSKKGIRINLHHMVQRQIEEYAETDTSRELGGILLGSPEASAAGVQLQVSAMLKAKKTAADKTSITFTHETWEKIHYEKEILYPDQKIVGWFHTHPGFGVFLSGYDLFIQQNFFNLPWQVAYVVDPVKKEQGFFAWDQAQVVPVPYGVTQDGKNTWVPLAAGQHRNEVADQPGGHPGNESAQPHANKGLAHPGHGWWKAACTASLLLLILTNLHRLSPEAEEDLEVRFAETGLQNEALISEIQFYEQRLEDMQQEYRGLEMTVAELSGGRFFVHTVEPGETLWSISRRFYNEPLEYVHVMRLNNLDDPDSLVVGQKLLLYRMGD